MKSMRTIGILLIHVTVILSACSSDNDPKANSSVSASTGGSSNIQNTGGTAAQSTNATSSGGSANPLSTGGSSAALQDAGISDASVDSSAPVAAPSIVGIYTDGFFEHRITTDTWYMDTSVFHITIVNNVADFLIAQADSKNQFKASLWNRFDWNIDGNNVLRFCETAYEAATEQDALDTPAANAQDFDKGCGGFSWSVLTPIQDGDAGTDTGS